MSRQGTLRNPVDDYFQVPDIKPRAGDFRKGSKSRIQDILSKILSSASNTLVNKRISACGIAFSHWHSTHLFVGLLSSPLFPLPGTHRYFSPAFHHAKEGIISLAQLKQYDLLPHRFCEKLWVPLYRARSGSRAKNHHDPSTQMLRNISQILVLVMLSLQPFQ